MDEATIRRLNALNREFYRVTADDFDQTRGHPWPGWARLLAHLPAPPLSVLDVGCGNGRLGVFLAQSVGARATSPPGPLFTSGEGEPGILYVGLDNNPALLARARRALARFPHVEARLEARDMIENPPGGGTYDLVALFGVLHHVPGSERRRALLRALAERVAPGGLLAFACWRFYEDARFRGRIVSWPDDLAEAIEPGDALLDWRRGERALRYCHYVDDTEHAALVAATGLAEIDTYRADGRSGDANRYSLLRRA